MQVEREVQGQTEPELLSHQVRLSPGQENCMHGDIVKDGDAAFFDAGTRVYTVKGYRTTFRLAIPLDGKVTLFEADTNPQARMGADLLDIQGKVKAIFVRSADDGTTELGSIKDAAQIKQLVEMIEGAPVKQDMSNGTLTCFIEFQLADGSSTTRAFWSETGELSRGIMTPATFDNVIKPIINKK